MVGLNLQSLNELHSAYRCANILEANPKMSLPRKAQVEEDQTLNQMLLQLHY